MNAIWIKNKKSSWCEETWNEWDEKCEKKNNSKFVIKTLIKKKMYIYNSASQMDSLLWGICMFVDLEILRYCNLKEIRVSVHRVLWTSRFRWKNSVEMFAVLLFCPLSSKSFSNGQGKIWAIRERFVNYCLQKE